MLQIRRHEALKQLSRDHHHGLLLCFHIREGLKKKVDPKRIKDYADFMWKTHLKQHFIAEEKYLFQILGKNNELIIRALNEHKKLDDLFHNNTNISNALVLVERELKEHIRFEEIILYNEIQEIATDSQLESLLINNKENFCSLWQDKFWK